MLLLAMDSSARTVLFLFPATLINLILVLILFVINFVETTNGISGIIRRWQDYGALINHQTQLERR